jgi:hypothetical protein
MQEPFYDESEFTVTFTHHSQDGLVGYCDGKRIVVSSFSDQNPAIGETWKCKKIGVSVNSILVVLVEKIEI